MFAFHQPAYHLRAAAASELNLIGFLRLSSLLSLEMPNHTLRAIRSVMSRLPDVEAELIEAKRFFVADHQGELLGGAGWSVLPLSFRAEHLVGPDGGAARLSLAPDAVLVRGFFLDPDLGRSGAGLAVLARIEADAAAAGHNAAELVVPTSSQLFYRSLGFRPVRRLGLALEGGNLLPVTQMRRCFSTGMALAA
jgi:GNAT superfamily N-acetyltransferase